MNVSGKHAALVFCILLFYRRMCVFRARRKIGHVFRKNRAFQTFLLRSVSRCTQFAKAQSTDSSTCDEFGRSTPRKCPRDVDDDAFHRATEACGCRAMLKANTGPPDNKRQRNHILFWYSLRPGAAREDECWSSYVGFVWSFLTLLIFSRFSWQFVGCSGRGTQAVSTTQLNAHLFHNAPLSGFALVSVCRTLLSVVTLPMSDPSLNESFTPIPAPPPLNRGIVARRAKIACVR